ncbi:membrane protein insertase YidC [Propionimicrobium sp. PCR01-08-3]|uniref:membrane protein insertase YidC n=1 Tax=Propionimicrobium sp. PCR01-08-3 TaxID=3052086 RepID=UPI00255C323B|nr:membrane protein insertase YidC [Propionimicrobium sp. PCR01-08-3]WIY82598.1 membrane protein insertase YidC [Propionimicrobium sp. PCR01-08-3]
MDFDPFLFLNLWDDISKVGSAIMQPLYWAVSGLIVLAHRLWSPLFGTDSGVTWALSIVVLTIIVRGLMMPLYAKQLNSSRAMQSLQPKIQALQQKYGSDRERLGQETMKLYKDEGVSPTSSCLPMLIQLPIFWGLYRVLYGAAQGQARGTFFVNNPDLVESLRHARLFGAQLSGTFLPMSDGFGATQILALIMIIMMTGLLFFQQLHMMRRNMPPTAFEGPMGQQQKMMLYMMPAMYIFIGPQIPIGVLVYWIISNLWTFVQQYVIIRNYPTPNTPAYVEWEERMVAKGKDPKEIERARANKARKGGNGKGQVATREVKGKDSGEQPTVSRQQVNRQTVRRSVDGKQVIQRQQVQHSSRAARKKKK